MAPIASDDAVRTTPSAAAVGSRSGLPRSGADARIRVVYCLDNLGTGGTELNAVRTAERLDRGRFDVRVYCFRASGPQAARYAAAGIPVTVLPIRGLVGLSGIREGVRFARALIADRVEIVHCHDFYSNIFGATWARIAGTPAVMTSRRWWYSLPYRRLRLANRLADRLADRVLANSPTVAASLSSVEGLGADRRLVVPNFVDDGAFLPMAPETRAAMRRELGLRPDALVVGCIARLVPVKDHATLLRAASRLSPVHPTLRLVLVGDGECRTELERLARELGIADRVVFTGFRPNEPNLHHLFDVSVLTSTSEGFPNTVVEAMAAGRPVVATAVGGTPDAVRPTTGLLVTPGSDVAVSDAIAALLSDPALAAAMGEAGRAVARAEYHSDIVIPRLEHAYEAMVKAARRSHWRRRGERDRRGGA